MAKRKALGRGMSAIIPENLKVEKKVSAQDSSSTSPAQFYFIPVGQIERNKYQPRLEFDKAALEELSQSIKSLGVIQPITVRRLGDKEFELISGERRLRASKLAGLKEIPAYIREADDEQMLEMALIENIQREDLNPIEVALSYHRLQEELKIDQKRIAEKVGKGRPTITNYLSLLKLSDEIKKSLKERSLSMGHAKSLKGFSGSEVPNRLLEIVLEQDLSVRQTESMAREIKKLPNVFVQQTLMGLIEDKQWSVKQVQDWVKKFLTEQEKPEKKVKAPGRNDIVIGDLSRQLEEKFGNKVKLKQNQEGKGEISIPFNSNDDLTRILEILDI